MGAGTGMTCFGFPGGIGTASRAVGDHHVGVLLLCNFGDRAYLDLLEHGLEARPGPAPERRLLHRGLRDRWPAVGAAAAPAGAAPAARAGPRRLVRVRRLGRDRPGVLHRPRAELPRRGSTPTSRPRTRPPGRRSTTAWSPPGRPGAATARMQEAFPTDAVQALAREARPARRTGEAVRNDPLRKPGGSSLESAPR